MRRTLEEECNGDLQDLRDVLESARADAVGALLVLLDLLECQAERVAEGCLTHRKHHPPHANAGADVLVDRVGALLGHLAIPLAATAPANQPHAASPRVHEAALRT